MHFPTLHQLNIAMSEFNDRQFEYRPPASLVLKALGIDKSALAQSSVTVSTEALKMLIGAFGRSGGFDADWYAEAYPDVQGAVLAGDLPSLEAHFERAGYLEGRSPCSLPCNPDYYFDRYPDLAALFDKDRPEELVAHYRTSGYFEGRAGLPENFADAERWLHGA